MIRDFRDLLKKRPRDIARLPLADQVAWGAKQSGRKLFTPQTVNAKGIGYFTVSLEIAKTRITSTPIPSSNSCCQSTGSLWNACPAAWRT